MNKYTTAFRRLRTQLVPLTQQYGRSEAYFLWDALKAHLRFGMTPNEYIGLHFYMLSNAERSKYFTARCEDKYHALFNAPEAASVFNRKEQTLRTFAPFVRRNWLYTPEASVQEVANFLAANPEVMVKPVEANCGRGIRLYKGDESPEALKQQGVLLEQRITQHPDLQAVNPDSVNTLRIYTLIPPAGKALYTGRPEENYFCAHGVLFVAALLRAGARGAIVDNFHAGGVGYPIDAHTGTIYMPGHNYRGEQFTRHPATGKQMIGMQIPLWNEVVEMASKAAKVEPRVRLVAWDFVVTPEGPELLEGNFKGCLVLMQGSMFKGKKELLVKNAR